MDKASQPDCLLHEVVAPIFSHPSATDEAWYWLKSGTQEIPLNCNCILHSGWVCILSRPAFFQGVVCWLRHISSLCAWYSLLQHNMYKMPCSGNHTTVAVHVNTTWTPHEHHVNTMWTPREHHVNTTWTLCEHHMNTVWTPHEHCEHYVNTTWTLWTPREHHVDALGITSIWEHLSANNLKQRSTLIRRDNEPDIDGFHGAWLHFRRARIGVCV